MANAVTTLAGLVTLNDQNALDNGLTDLLDDAPFLAAALAVPASNGTNHKYKKTTTASGSGFRAVGGGRTLSSSQVELVTDVLKILDASYVVDKSLADAFMGGGEAWLERELVQALRAAFFDMEKQIFLGTNNDASGFSGFQDLTTLDATSDTMVVDGGGTTASKQTDVWLIRNTEQDIAPVIGNDGVVSVSDATVIEKVVNPGTDNKTYPAYYVAVDAYVGLQIGGAYSAARLANIDTNDLTSTTALTDDLIYQTLAKFPAGRQPTHIAMNRDSLSLLRQSRTATNATGAPAPRPTEVEGIPIVVTDAIVSTQNQLS